MWFVWMLAGAALSAFVCAGTFRGEVGPTAALLGAMIGLLFAQLSRVRSRLAELEKRISKTASESAASSLRTDTPLAPLPSRVAPTPLSTPSPIIEPEPARPALEKIAAAAVPEMRIEAPSVVAPTRARPTAPPAPDPVQIAIGRVKRWFTEGNVPVKVGVLVLFLGVAALLKYAADAGWLRVPIEFRLAGIALVALAALAFAWRKRESHRTFALAVQGGAVGILILVVFAAFRVYPLLPAGLAFVLLVVIVAATGVLAVAQDALALAVLAVVAGFAAPILTSNGQGSHIVLFGYYAILNAMIFGVAWVRPWRALNVLGFIFTFGVGTAWGVLKYQPGLLPSTEPFLLLFFAFYLCIPVLYARRQDDSKRDLIDSTLVFGTPLAVFPLQAALLDGARMPLAFIALAAALIYIALAALELRKLGLRLLGQSHALLGLGFATLAVPLALSARATACAWALEGAALVWLGFRQRRRLPRWIGYALQGAAGLAFVYGFQIGTGGTPILNGEFFSAMLIAIGGAITAWLVFRADRSAPLAIVFFMWTWAWWWFACGRDIERFSPAHLQSDWVLALIAFTATIGAFVYRRLDWPTAAWPALFSFAAAFPLLVFIATDNHGSLEGWACASWAVWFAASLFALHALAQREHPHLPIAHAAFAWLIALNVSGELQHAMHAHLLLGDIWTALAALAPIALLFWLVLRRVPAVRWPSANAAERSRFSNLAASAGLLGIAWFGGLFFEGQPDPLPYIPVLNPLELPQLGYLLLLLAWFRSAAVEGNALTSSEARARLLAVAAFLLLTSITLRGTHFIGGVPWSEALWDSALAQAALSIVWTIAGIAAMLLGKQRGSRAVWIGGGTLMGVVILKLLLIDRQHLHDLTAIVGVLVVGLLLVGVGYFAPVPPRANDETAS